MQSSRRTFLKTAAISGAVLPAVHSFGVHAAGTDTIKIGLVGCGGRGRGAVQNALNADPNAVVVAVADAFEDKASNTLDALRNEDKKRKEANPNSVARVHSDAQAYAGFDAYRKVVDVSDVVLLCEVPHFRPISLRYAVEKGKHVFCEKPVAVDGAGVKSVLESAKIAQEKKLNIVSGLCWRYDNNIRELFKHIIDDKTLGDILSTRVSYQTGRLWQRPRQPQDTELLYQIRNWYNFTWLSGDFNVEQAVHSVDKMMWSFNDQCPLSAWGNGGRMVRVEYPASGDIYDTMSVTFDFGEGRTGYLFCRQINNTYSETVDHIIGTKGYAETHNGGFGGATVHVRGEEKPMRIKKSSDMYNIEHQFLFQAVRGDIPYINDGVRTANSTMAGILARQVARTGRNMKWQDGLDYAEPMRPAGFDPEGNLIAVDEEATAAAKKQYEETLEKQPEAPAPITKTVAKGFYENDTVPPTLPDASGRYKVEVNGLGYVYHEVKR